MTKMRKRIFGLGCAAVFALSQIPLAFHAGSLVASADEANTVTLVTYDGDKTMTVVTENGKLPELPTPEREGYDFVGWFTAPVDVEFWGDESGERWETLKAKYSNTGYTYLNGRSIEWYNKGETPDPRYADDAGYDWKNARWIEHSLGLQNATKGKLVHEGDVVSAGSTLYAMYDPKNITVYWYSNGWKNIHDTEYASTGRSTGFEYGGKFARLPLDRWAPWQGHDFKGWVDANGKQFVFDTDYAAEMLETPYTPDKYEPVLRLYAIYDDITEAGGASKPAEFKGLTGGGRTFDPNLGSHTFTATFDSKNKLLPDNMGWKLTSGAEHFHLTVSKDKTVATVTVKNEFKNNLPYDEKVGVEFTFGEETYETYATASHYYNNGKVVSGQWGACTTDYVVKYTCTACQQEKIVTTEAQGHDNVSYEVPATCTEDGYTVEVCVKCGEKTRTDHPGSALGHQWSEETKAGCDGTVITKTCTRCGETQVETTDVAVHTWESSPTVDVAPTCTEAGQKSVHCKLCRAVKETEIIPATGHRYKETKHAATCTKDGYTEKVCSACGDVQTVITQRATGHTEGEHVRVKKATCIENGTYNVYCADCGAWIKSEKISVDPNAHDWSVWLEKTEDGYKITYRYCVLCHKYEEKSKVAVAPAPQADPAPVEPAPTEPAPAEHAPAEPVPAEPAPVEPLPEPEDEPQTAEPEIAAPEVDEQKEELPETKEELPETEEELPAPEEELPETKEELPVKSEEELPAPEETNPPAELVPVEPEVDEPEVIEPENEPEVAPAPEVVENEPEVDEPETVEPAESETLPEPQKEAAPAPQVPQVLPEKLPRNGSATSEPPVQLPQTELAPKMPAAPAPETVEQPATGPVASETDEQHGNASLVNNGEIAQSLSPIEETDESSAWMWIVIATVCGAAIICVPTAVIVIKRRK